MRPIAVTFVVAATCLIPEAAVAQGTAAAAARPQTVVRATVLNTDQSSISGVAVTPMGQPLANTLVRARNLLTAQIGGSTSTASTGHFSIVGLTTGSYVVEVVDRAGQVIGTSSFIAAAAGATGAITVTATVGTLSAISTTTGLAATLTTAAADSVKVAATAAGFAGVVVPAGIETASPSR
jgi:hypothetical protein